MKYIVFTLFLCSLFSGCSPDGDSYAFNSSIDIDGELFNPSEITAYPDNQSFENATVFVLGRNTSAPENQNIMVVKVIYPLSQTNASGTYLINGTQGTGNYTRATDNYLLYNGSVTVVDSGNNNYTLTFNNVKGNQGNGATEVITINGTISGRFRESN
jgi:hypothetical protein